MVLPISLSCFIVILAQSAATSRAYALRYRNHFNQNVDLIGLSLANAVAGFRSTFVVNGSPTKTAMVDTPGGRISGPTSLRQPSCSWFFCFDPSIELSAQCRPRSHRLPHRCQTCGRWRKFNVPRPMILLSRS
jgi:hypothetical protein